MLPLRLVRHADQYVLRQHPSRYSSSVFESFEILQLELSSILLAAKSNGYLLPEGAVSVPFSPRLLGLQLRKPEPIYRQPFSDPSCTPTANRPNCRPASGVPWGYCSAHSFPDSIVRPVEHTCFLSPSLSSSSGGISSNRQLGLPLVPSSQLNIALPEVAVVNVNRNVQRPPAWPDLGDVDRRPIVPLEDCRSFGFLAMAKLSPRQFTNHLRAALYLYSISSLSISSLSTSSILTRSS